VRQGSDGVRLWNIKTQTHLRVPDQNHAQRGPVCCVLWVTREHDTEEILAYGTVLGYLVIWVHRQVGLWPILQTQNRLTR
jgi:hypothetical protein